MASDVPEARAYACCNAVATHASACLEMLACGLTREAVFQAALAQRAVNALMASMPGELVDEVSVEMLGPGAPGEE